MADNEDVYRTVLGTDGLTYAGEGDSKTITRPVVVVVTDRRLVFVTAGERDIDAGSLPYAEVASVQVTSERVVFTTDEGVRCTVVGIDGAADAVLAHLRWIGELRSRLIACRNAVDRAAAEVRDHASASEWEEGEATYADVRERLDRLVVAVQWTEPVPDGLIAPELTGMERTLERAIAELWIARAESELDRGRQLVEYGAVGRLESVLGDAEEYFERARSRAAAVDRADEFRFGEQRQLRDALDGVSREIERLATAPLDEARRARERAEAADDAVEAVDRLETALQHYRDASAIDLDTVEAADVDSEMATVAGELVDRHRDIARDAWNAGADHSDDGEVEAAMRRWREATEHLERAAHLADEFDHEDAADIEGRIDRVGRARARLRESADSGRTPSGSDDRTGPTAFPGKGTDIGPNAVPRPIDSVSSPGGRGTDAGFSNGTGGDVDGEELADLTEAIIQSDPNEE